MSGPRRPPNPPEYVGTYAESLVKEVYEEKMSVREAIDRLSAYRIDQRLEESLCDFSGDIPRGYFPLTPSLPQKEFDIDDYPLVEITLWIVTVAVMAYVYLS